MSIPLFPEATGFVEECLRSVGIMLEDSITQHMLFELTIHVQGRLCSEKQKGIDFCGLLSGMLNDVPTEHAPMKVMWEKGKRMLKTYRESVDTAKKNRKFDANWSPGSNPGLRQQLEDPFQINPPQVLVISNALPL